mmetsp:Transcript_86761/g.173178  ORF Transcript_86761/g.173178 Transcript_86761/m.173178 type:complete len:81 (-) Transcript_86761:401-643(-)|eukprot:CAMPEP_0174714406 /NCGR_PEP_ID=MMETSP1094-20130205/17636_1 /TAXON_ID=156173 /ORGANISM="Chrysochromulina brevifilum, Strain UTEX LB 985" /LENGTH=80 /DNA_ID=CAMNT_0015913751 /DNA_START=92 /DNA_END=334 /DNA_ORIENTATION=-
MGKCQGSGIDIGGSGDLFALMGMKKFSILDEPEGGKDETSDSSEVVVALPSPPVRVQLSPATGRCVEVRFLFGQRTAQGE